MPAVSLAAVKIRRQSVLERAVEIEAHGFDGIYCPMVVDPMSLCLSMAHRTSTITFGTSIQSIYVRHPSDLAGAAAYLHEVSGGRFRLGLGMNHIPTHERLGVEAGPPLDDVARYVNALRAVEGDVGPLPPIYLAAMRKRMVALAAEIADGAIWANACRSHMASSLGVVTKGRAGRDAAFFIGNMIPTVVDDDVKAAHALHRRTLSNLARLPNYRNYWREAGYVEEMDAIEAAVGRGDTDDLPSLVSDAWLADTTLSGSPSTVRDGIEAWFDAGVTTPIVVPSALSGGQPRAVANLFRVYA
jgi:alkanesulfonate monooxygenase SsuD/methylene tetrahydromethanopterin reductase-like flavin-dependent oxidoreductase (luciferase family)